MNYIAPFGCSKQRWWWRSEGWGKTWGGRATNACEV